MNKKGFNNLAHKEQGEQQKQEEEENQDQENDQENDHENDQEKAPTLEETYSCEHLAQRDGLEKENQAEAEKNQETDGTIFTHWFCLQSCFSYTERCNLLNS